MLLMEIKSACWQAASSDLVTGCSLRNRISPKEFSHRTSLSAKPESENSVVFFLPVWHKLGFLNLRLTLPSKTNSLIRNPFVV